MKKGEIRLYNVIFPIWLIWLAPQVLCVVLPVNFLIDLAAVAIALAALGLRPVWKQAVGVIWRVWFFGFLADIAGAALLLGVLCLPGNGWLNDAVQAMASNPFQNPAALCFVCGAILVSAALIYVYNRFICLKNLRASLRQKRCIALTLAIATAPYAFLLPTRWFF